MLSEGTSTTASSANTSFDDSLILNSPYGNLIIQKTLSRVNSIVFQVLSLLARETLAMKVMPYYEGKISEHYINEVRFAYLKHPNIVSVVYYEPEKDFSFLDLPNKCSYILMELAPYGDFFDLIMNYKIPFAKDVKLTRTFFHQLLEGVEYLHSEGIYHLDLKPENLLLGENFLLKICDFDLSLKKGDEKIKYQGTKFFRAPEILHEECTDPAAADIFSIAIILFLLKSGGVLPQTEAHNYRGVNLYRLLQLENKKFWDIHLKRKDMKPEYFEEEFRVLFNHMTRENPKERATIQDIKNSKWYNGEIYTTEELKKVMNSYLLLP